MSRRRYPTGSLGFRRGVSIGLFLVGFLLTCASAATAYWSIPVVLDETNHAIAEAGRLAAPTDPTATANGSHAITVEWGVPANQLPGAQYRVTRTGGPGAGAVVCPAATTSCVDDTDLDAGTEYTYSIAAVIGDHWQSPAVFASATTLAVTTASLETARFEETYSMVLSAVGGSGPFTWALAPSSSELPSWASLSPAGTITGTPDAVGTTVGLVFTVTDSGGTAMSGLLELTVAQGLTTTTVSPSADTATYGAESAIDFVVTVLTANNVLVTSGSVTVSVGTATCTVPLASASSCSIGDTDLSAAGGPYVVSATFEENANLASSTSDPSDLTVEPDAATVSAFTVSGSPALYGDATSLVFAATVTTGHASLPGTAVVSVTQGSTALCTITLTTTLTSTSRSGTCSPASGTVLPVGTHPDVTATFSASNFATDTEIASVTVSPDTATVDTFTVANSPAPYGAETTLVFSASVSAEHAGIPDGAVVPVTQGSTTLCTITLASGAGSCSPASGTVLPVGTYADVTATFNAAGIVDPNFTSDTATTTVTINPGLAGIRWASVSTTGTFTCISTNPTAVTCTATGAGNRGTFQANVQLVKADGTPFTNLTGANVIVTETTTGGGGTTTASGSMVIAQSTPTSSGAYTLTLNKGRPPTTTITASVTVGGVTYTVNCAVSR